VLTAFGTALATLGWLCAATVAALGFAGSKLGSAADNTAYTSDLLRQPGLRPGVVTTFILLTIPVLALVAQCSRLGAPARDRRVAAIRLAGATPRQAVAIGAGEAAAASLFGSAVGVAVYFLLRRLLDHVNSSRERTLPTDVVPKVSVIVVIALALPVVVTLLSAWLLRGVATSPLGVARRVRRRHAPRPWPGVLIVVGVGLFAVIEPLTELLSRHGMQVSETTTVSIVYAGVVSAAAGVALGAGWMSHTSGRVLRRFGRKATTQLAGARMIADPWQGSRTFDVLVVAAIFGGGTAAAFRYFATLAATEDAQNRLSAVGMQEQYIPGASDTFYTSATLLVAIAVGLAVVIAALGQLVSISEAIVTRRRTYAALVATGVPRSALARVQLWQSSMVAVPAFILAGVTGVLIVRLLLETVA
jgi:predicted lysophospholipase L1 biosynthesis ABC-type transport system permease subunit